MGVGGQLHAPAALFPGTRPGTTCVRGWVSSRVGLDGRGKFCFFQDSIPEPASPWRIATPTELSRFTLGSERGSNNGGRENFVMRRFMSLSSHLIFLFVRNSRRINALGRPRNKWSVNTKTDLIDLREAIPLCEQNRYRKNPSNTTKRLFIV
jgi:hypothetical protein